jgi:predicted nucleic acid-binding protein
VIGGAPRIYFDANAFMYAFEGDEQTRAPVRRLLHRLVDQPSVGVTSELVPAELLAPITRPGALSIEIRRRMYLDLLVRNSFFDLRPVTRDILLETSHLRERAKLKLPDAIHLATAIASNCRYMLSNDDDFDRAPGLIRVEPDEAGIEILLGALA